MAHDVFISHSVKDKVTADAVCAVLESAGIRCWIAPRDVMPGMEWGECIIEAIEQTRVMVLVFTADANASPQIRREVERAVNHGVAVLPVRIEDVMPGRALEYFIGNVHWLDALTPPLEAHLKSLAGTIKILLARKEKGAPTTLPQEERPQTTGGFGATKKVPEVADAHEKSSAPRHLWTTGSWTWAGGAVATFLLLIIFLGVHFTSHRAPVASTEPSPSPAQNTPGLTEPSGTAPATPRTSPSPGQIRAPVAPKIAKSVAKGPAAAVDNAKSLRDTMKVLQHDLSDIGTVSYTIFFLNRDNGNTSSDSIVDKIDSIEVDSGHCGIAYRELMSVSGPDYDKPAIPDRHGAYILIPLHEVEGVVTMRESQRLANARFVSPPRGLDFKSISPDIETVAVAYSIEGTELSELRAISFVTVESANRFADTFRGAVRLCGGNAMNSLPGIWSH